MVKEDIEQEFYPKTREEEKEFEDALDFCGIDKQEHEEKLKIISDPPKDDVVNKVTNTESFASDYEHALKGMKYKKHLGSYVQAGKALAGSHFIKLTSELLSTFAKSSNMISSKEMDSFNLQFEDSFLKVNNLATVDRSISDRNTRMVVSIFKSSMWNIGDIITNNKGNRDSVFRNAEEGDEKGYNPITGGAN